MSMSVDQLTKISSSGSDSSPSTKEVTFVDMLLRNPKHKIIQSIFLFASYTVVDSVLYNNKCEHWLFKLL